MPAANSQAFRRADIFFLSPWLLTLLIFWLFPILASLVLSFTKYGAY
jgi:ABC-type sugar transport system permease subunit